MTEPNIPWVEKFRPKILDNVILHVSDKKIIKSIIDIGAENLPNLLFSGSPGTGKTTLAKVIANELDMPCLHINASDESGIDTIRTKVKGFGSSMSVDGKIKLIIIDEADGLSFQAQKAFKGVIESFHKSTRFVFTCNYSERIMDALKSRLKEVQFKTISIKPIKKRIIEILKNENINVSKSEGIKLINMIERLSPDIRKIINHLQYFSSTGDLEIEDDIDADVFEEIITMIKEKKLSNIREILRNNKCDYNLLIAKVFDSVLDDKNDLLGNLNETQRAKIILLCSESLFRSSFAVDKEISFASFTIECMAIL